MTRTYMLRAVACAALVASLPACNDETSTVLAPLNRKAYNFLLTREGSNVPRFSGGTITVSRTAAQSATQATSTIADFQIQGLEQLTPPAGYVIWIASISPTAPPSTDSTLTNLVRLRTSAFFIINTDTSVSAGDFVPRVDTMLRQVGAGTVPASNSGGPGVRYVFRTDSATLGVYPHNRNLIFVTVVTDTASPPLPASNGTDARLWMRFAAGIPPACCVAPATVRDSITNPALAFGNGNAAVSKQYSFIASGRGKGSLLSDKNVMILDDSILARPPKGYYYETWLIARADSTNFFARDSLSLGPQTAPYPRRAVSLYGADSAQVDQVVQAVPPIIFAASNRVQGDSLAGLSTTTANRFRGIANAFITLEAKLGTPAMSPAIILGATMPPPIRNRN